MKRGMWLLLGLGFMAPAAGADDASKPGVVAFNASVRVEVDASGKPVKVEAPADLPRLQQPARLVEPLGAVRHAVDAAQDRQPVQQRRGRPLLRRDLQRAEQPGVGTAVA